MYVMIYVFLYTYKYVIHIYVCISVIVTSSYMYMYHRVRLRSSHAGLQWHVSYCMHSNTFLPLKSGLRKFQMFSSQFNFTRTFKFSSRSWRVSWVLHTTCIPWWIVFEVSETTTCMSFVSVLTVYPTLCIRRECTSTVSEWSWFHRGSTSYLPPSTLS